MSDAALSTDTQKIMVDEVFPHKPALIWKALTSGDLMARWMMQPSGFEPVQGRKFTFQTTPTGAWDGIIHCEILEVRPNELFAYSWKAGHEGNVGYGSKLNTVVTWTLSQTAAGTRVRLIHSGFKLPDNETAFRGMGEGWIKIFPRLLAVIGEKESLGSARANPAAGETA